MGIVLSMPLGVSLAGTIYPVKLMGRNGSCRRLVVGAKVQRLTVVIRGEDGEWLITQLDETSMSYGANAI